MLVIGVIPSCVIVIGIEFEVPTPPLVFNVVVLAPDAVACTKSALLGWANDRMVAALAGVDSASEARHAAANRVSVERMVLLLPL